jgi:hypothetical protein
VCLNVWERKQQLPVAPSKLIMTISADIGPKMGTVHMGKIASKYINVLRDELQTSMSVRNKVTTPK